MEWYELEELVNNAKSVIDEDDRFDEDTLVDELDESIRNSEYPYKIVGYNLKRLDDGSNKKVISLILMQD
jgi:hypothetical protein